MFEPSSGPVQDTPPVSGDDTQATSGNETPDYPSSDAPSATGGEAPETTGDDIQAAAAANVSYDYNATPYSPHR